jgi:hypothetical protein
MQFSRKDLAAALTQALGIQLSRGVAVKGLLG